MAAPKRTLTSLAALLSLSAALTAQTEQKALNSITAEDLRAHLSFVAADETQGRDTPSTAVNIVSRYLATTAARYGLKPIMPGGSFFQEVPLEVTSVSTARSRLRVISPGGDETFYCPESFGGSFRTSGSWSGEVVFLGYGLSAPDAGWDDYENVNLNGKVAVLLDAQLPADHPLHADGRATLRARANMAGSRGASLVLTVVNPDREKAMTSQASGFTLSRRTAMAASYPSQNQSRVTVTTVKTSTQAPAARNAQPSAYRPAVSAGQAEIRHELAASILGISRNDLESLFASIASGRRVPRKSTDKRIELSIVTETHRDSSPNVVAMLEGSDPVLKGEYVVISSHHDHLGMRDGTPMDGADDNGSGTVAMLEIAQALSIERPKRSVVFAWFTGEEKGLLGSHYFVNNCPVPLEKISAELNLDMISRNDPDRLFLIASNNLSTELDGSIRDVNDRYFKMTFDYVYNDRTQPDRFYYRSDHYPFLRMGIPAVWFFCGTTPDYHQHADTIDRVDFAKMEKVTRLTYLVACDIGNKAALLKLDANPDVTSRGKHNNTVESIR